MHFWCCNLLHETPAVSRTAEKNSFFAETVPTLCRWQPPFLPGAVFGVTPARESSRIFGSGLVGGRRLLAEYARQKNPTAMEAGVADHVWSLEEIVGLLCCQDSVKDAA